MEIPKFDPNTVTMESAQQLIKLRDQAEKEIVEIMGRLRASPVGLSGNLLDEEGFPRSDIDIPAIRADRHRLACLQNDLKELMHHIEESIYIIHAKAREQTEPGKEGK